MRLGARSQRFQGDQRLGELRPTPLVGEVLPQLLEFILLRSAPSLLGSEGWLDARDQILTQGLFLCTMAMIISPTLEGCLL